jgi:hypothetical protein
MGFLLNSERGKALAEDGRAKLMEKIKLLLAHSDRRVTNQIEVSVLDVCFDRAVVQSTRISRLDEFVHQGGLWDYDLIIVGGEHLFRDKTQQSWASVDEVVKGIETIRAQSSNPIVVLAKSSVDSEALLAAGADAVLSSPFDPEDLKTELRALLDLSDVVEIEHSGRWSGIGSLFRGFQRAKLAS